MVLLNARSIRNKVLEFRALIAAFEYDAIAIMETWLSEIRDFDGVMLYVRSHLAAIGDWSYY